MKTLNQFLLENAAEVSMTASAFVSLSEDAKEALGRWEYSNWRTGELAKAYASKNSIYREIEAAMEPVRQAIAKREGKTIRLYRGIGNNAPDKAGSDRLLYSWTSRPKYAALFADTHNVIRGKIKSRKDFSSRFVTLTDAQIDAAAKQLVTKGFVKLEDVSFKTYDDARQWYSGYIGTREYVYGNDTKGFAKYIKSTRDENIATNKAIDETGFVVYEDIPVKDIVWFFASDSLTKGIGKSMEYIVKGHSGSNGTRIEV